MKSLLIFNSNVARVLLLAVVMVLLLAAYPAPTLAQQTAFTPEFEIIECWFAMDLSIGQRATCGYVTVPEDHQQPDGATIRLGVVVVHSANPNRQPDPVIFLQGGPGGAATGLLKLPSPVRERITEQRDMIYFDQRGTGLSKPTLACPEVSPLDNEKGAYTRNMLACRDRWTAAGVNLAAYTNAQNAADVEAIRLALGYEQWNLYGFSYGTWLALTVMRDHPAGLRSVLLDSTVTPEADTYAERPALMDMTFRRLFADCAADFLCNLAYPNLETVYFDLYDRLNVEPLVFDIPVSGLNSSIEFRLDGEVLSSGIISFAGDRIMRSQLPGLIYSLNTGDYEPLQNILEMQISGLSASPSGMAMAQSIMCTNEIPHSKQSEAVAVIATFHPATQGGVLEITEASYELCEQWMDAEIDPADAQPVISDIPTLLLSGELDPATPPRWSEAATQNLSRGYAFTFPGVMHGVLGTNTCSLDIALAFLTDPANMPDAACIDSLRPMEFMLTATATRPIAQLSTLLLGAAAVWGAGSVGYALRRRPRQVAWRGSLQIVGWLPLLASASLILLLMLPESESEFRARVVEIIIPLVMAAQAALLLSPDDEPALEIMLASPRPLSWVLLERLTIAFVLQVMIAILGIALSFVLAPGQDVWIALLRWLPPTIFLSGVGAYVTLRSRVAAFGVAIAGVVWFAFTFFGEFLLPGVPTFWPLNYLQPFIWPFHPFLQPENLAIADYWLNRLCVSVAGISLLMLAVYQLRQEETVLLGTRKSNR